MPQEMVGDIAVAGADEVQHLDDRAVRRHRAAGRERHRDDRRRDHQHEDADAGNTVARSSSACARSRRGDRRRSPTAPPASPPCAGLQGRACRAARATMTRTGNCSIDSPLPSHGSSSLADSSLLNGLTRTMPGCVRIASTAAVTSLEIAPRLRAHLHGDFAGDFRLPFRGRCADEQHGAGGDGRGTS